MSRTGGLAGMQYTKKSFTVMPDNLEIKANPERDAEIEKQKAVDEAESVRIQHELDEQRKKSKKFEIIPFGNRILVKRRRIGGTIGAGILISADETSERPTDLADVLFTPEHTLCDKQLIANAELIVSSLTTKASGGNADALNALMEFNKYLKIKTIRKGDAVMISKYIGTDFHDNSGGGNLTLVDGEDIIGLIVEVKSQDTKQEEVK